MSDDKSKTTWDEAHKACKAKNPKAELASIKGPIDQGRDALKKMLRHQWF